MSHQDPAAAASGAPAAVAAAAPPAAAAMSSGLSQGSGAEFWNIDAARIVFVQENPKKNGSKAYEKYEAYKSAGTIGAARAAGASTTEE